MRAAPREYFIGGNVRNGLRHDERNSRYDMNRRRAHVATLSHHASRSEYCHCRYANSKTTGAHADPPDSHYGTITVKLGQHQPFADIARKYGILPKSSVGFGPPTHRRANDSGPRPRCAYALARPKLRAIGFVGAFEAMGEGTVPGECGIMVMAGRVPSVRFQLERSI
jgi:hypothetical protein